MVICFDGSQILQEENGALKRIYQAFQIRQVMMWVRTSAVWVVVLANIVASTSVFPQKTAKLLNPTEGGLGNGAPGQPLTTPKQRVLGEKCIFSKHCGATLSMCHKGRCVCRPNYLALNATHCLPGVLLGFKCRVDAQCSMRVANSACIQGYCRCGANYVPYHRNNCLKAAQVGEVCRSQAQCLQGTRYSFCNFTVPRVYGRCRCNNRQLPTAGNTCPHLRYPLGSACGTTAQCSSSVPGSVCVIQASLLHTTRPFAHRVSNTISSSGSQMDPRPVPGMSQAVCACPPGHLEEENGTRCIPVLKDVGVTPASLGQRCLNSEQCQASDPFTVCRDDGVCHCVVDSAECSATNTGCHKDTFQCASSGRCISWYYVCNGDRDCDDESDESSCVPHRCPKAAHTCADGTCISRAHLCDGNPHCPDKSDETNCHDPWLPRATVRSREPGGCPSTTFRCGDGRCLPGFVFCNAHTTCTDGTDEDEAACIQGAITAPYCPFRCQNGRCRSTAILCSGSDGCGDNSDEENCSVCSCRRPT